jgi:hypothetical protein
MSTPMIKCKKKAKKKCMKKGMRNDIGNTLSTPDIGAERVAKWKEQDGWIFEATGKKDSVMQKSAANTTLTPEQQKSMPIVKRVRYIS